MFRLSPGHPSQLCTQRIHWSVITQVCVVTEGGGEDSCLKELVLTQILGGGSKSLMDNVEDNGGLVGGE